MLGIRKLSYLLTASEKKTAKITQHKLKTISRRNFNFIYPSIYIFFHFMLEHVLSYLHVKKAARRFFNIFLSSICNVACVVHT